MFKKRPRQDGAKVTAEAVSKLEPAYWEQRLFKNTFTYKGRTRQVKGWSVKIQLFGRRKTFSLGASDRIQAGAEACHIFQTIHTHGWEAVSQRRAHSTFQNESANRGPGAIAEVNSDYWRSRLIHRRYPEPIDAGTPRELSVRIEHSGISRYFPLGTNDEAAAASHAMRVYKTVTEHGWAVANQQHARELTLALRWLDDPLAWTYITIHTRRTGANREQRNPTSRGVALVEPDAGIRDALVASIRTQTGFECGASFTSIAEAEREILRQAVDFILINYSLPDQPGAVALEKLRKVRPGLNGLLYSVYEDSDELFRATPGGSAGYMLKRTPAHRIFEPIAEVTGPLTREVIAAKIRDYFQRLVAAMPTGPSVLEMARLTPREQEILSLLAKGGLAKEIADALGISVWTVHGHIKSIFEKLDVHTRTEAVVKFLQK